MRHELVVQLPITGPWGTDAELQLRHRLEEELQEALGELGVVDGGDIGSGNVNIFIVEIPDAAPALERVKAVLARHAVLDRAIIQRTTYQSEEDDEPSDEAVVWPEGFTGTFSLF